MAAPAAPSSPRTRSRTLLGLAVGIAGVAVVTLVLTPIRDHFTPAAPAALLVVPVVTAAAYGSWRAAITTALVATAAFSFAFVPPLDSFRFHEDAIAVPVFLMVALVVGAVVAAEVNRRHLSEQREHDMALVHEREARLAEELNRAAVLEQVDQQRAALLRSVSHDLRTPLAAICAASSDLRDGIITDEHSRHELLELVNDQAKRLDRLVANLLDLSRIEAGALRPDLQAVAVDELVKDRLGSLRRVFDGIDVRVDVPTDLPLVSVDYTQIGQVFGNLLENAARHSPSGGAVTVTATARGAMVEVVVSDEGKGIESAEMSHIFEPFRASRGSSSTGIGLAICKAIVDAHGGTIWATNGMPAGAQLHFTVPVCDG